MEEIIIFLVVILIMSIITFIILRNQSKQVRRAMYKIVDSNNRYFIEADFGDGYILIKNSDHFKMILNDDFVKYLCESFNNKRDAEKALLEKKTKYKVTT